MGLLLMCQKTARCDIHHLRGRPSPSKAYTAGLHRELIGSTPPAKLISMQVQIAAFMGWFPYLFYSTTYVAQVMANELGREPDLDKATRAGSLALLIYSFGRPLIARQSLISVVAIAAGTILPYLASRDRRLLGPESEVKHEDDMDEEEAELEHVRELIRQWKAEAARQGRPLRLPASGCEVPKFELTLPSAVHVAEYLDNGFAAFRRNYGFDFFHHYSLAGDCSSCCGRYMLGHRLLGTIRNHHGISQRSG